jgi:ABC-type dipeptide/oligopeptide/nickel transport system permease subunit
VDKQKHFLVWCFALLALFGVGIGIAYLCGAGIQEAIFWGAAIALVIGWPVGLFIGYYKEQHDPIFDPCDFMADIHGMLVASIVIMCAVFFAVTL